MKKSTDNSAEKQTQRRAPKILDSLEGSVIETEKTFDEPQEPEDDAPARSRSKNTLLFFIIGVIIIALSAVGLVTVIKGTVGAIGDAINQTALKQEFADFVYPFVITDSPAFDSVANTPPSVIINTAIWKIIMSGDTDKYESDGLNMIISQIDVERSAASIFGYSAVIEHQSVGYGDNMFRYDEETKSYSVPTSLNYNTYWPRVSEISNIGESYTVTVEYMPPQMYIMEGMDSSNEPDKIMIFTISRSASAMTIQSVKYSEQNSLNE